MFSMKIGQMMFNCFFRYLDWLPIQARCGSFHFCEVVNIMGKLNVTVLRYLSKEDFRVLISVILHFTYYCFRSQWLKQEIRPYLKVNDKGMLFGGGGWQITVMYSRIDTLCTLIFRKVEWQSFHLWIGKD